MGQVDGQRKRARSPPYPPFVADYAPYTGGQLRRACLEKHKANHKQHWDLYYRNNTVNGYKDRHYILREFEELRAAIEVATAECAVATDDTPCDTTASTFAWMEAGCGVGNAMLPIFEEHGHLPQWRALLGFDISSVAIALLEEKVAALPEALARKVHVCTLNPCERDVAECVFFELGDAAAHPTATEVGEDTNKGPSRAAQITTAPRSPQNKVEFVSMVFVLCSIPVAMHAHVLRRIAACMVEPTGVFFFRDYCVSDHAERRFRERDARVGRMEGGDDNRDPNTFTRTNGTLSHFFSTEEVRELFLSVGFEVIDLREVEREVQNRKTECVLSRKFVQGRFRLTKLKL